MRIFIYDGRTFPDPDPNLTADEVRQSLSQFFPELANAEIVEAKQGDDTAYEFKRRVGTKGAPIAECRFCEHLKNAGKPGGNYIGTCELGLRKKDCNEFELAACFEGHDPRKQDVEEVTITGPDGQQVKDTDAVLAKLQKGVVYIPQNRR